MNKKIFLSIAASDNIGGAGIQADNRTASSLGLYPVNVVTAITAQNSMGVVMMQPVSVNLLLSQFDCILQDLKPDCVKIGFLPSVECAREISILLKNHKLENIVVDPVLSPTRGSFDNDENIGKAIIQYFSDIACLFTPNLPELEKLNECGNKDVRDVFKAILVKGGHAGGENSNDLLIENSPDGSQKKSVFQSKRIHSSNTHGSGCVLSSAVACYLGMGQDLHEAVENAKRFINSLLIKNKDINFGQGGYGPIIF